MREVTARILLFSGHRRCGLNHPKDLHCSLRLSLALVCDLQLAAHKALLEAAGKEVARLEETARAQLLDTTYDSQQETSPDVSAPNNTTDTPGRTSDPLDKEPPIEPPYDPPTEPPKETSRCVRVVHMSGRNSVISCTLPQCEVSNFHVKIRILEQIS